MLAAELKLREEEVADLKTKSGKLIDKFMATSERESSACARACKVHFLSIYANIRIMWLAPCVLINEPAVRVWQAEELNTNLMADNEELKKKLENLEAEAEERDQAVAYSERAAADRDEEWQKTKASMDGRAQAAVAQVHDDP